MYLFHGFYTNIKKTGYRNIAAFGAFVWFLIFSITFLMGIISKIEFRALDHISSWNYVLILSAPIMVRVHSCPSIWLRRSTVVAL